MDRLDSLNVITRKSMPFYFVILSVLSVYICYIAYSTMNPWRVADWLINYHGGFVRRGLIGECIYLLSIYTKINPSVYVFILQSLLYVCFLFVSYLLLRKEKNLIPYILIIFSPFLFTFHINNFPSSCRKEILYFAMLSMTTYFTLYGKQRAFDVWFYFLAALYPFMVLSHEMFIVFLPYVLMTYFWKAKGNFMRSYAIVAMVALSCIAFLFSTMYHGTPAQVQDILRSLEYMGCHFEDGIINSLEDTYILGVKLVWSCVVDEVYFDKYALALVLAAIAYLPLAPCLERAFRERMNQVLLGASIVGTLVLMTCAADWGRFIYIHCVSLFFIALLYCHSDLDNVLQARWSRYLSDIINMRWPRILFVYAFIAAYIFMWSIPHFGKTPILANGLVRVNYLRIFLDLVS